MWLAVLSGYTAGLRAPFEADPADDLPEREGPDNPGGAPPSRSGRSLEERGEAGQDALLGLRVE